MGNLRRCKFCGRILCHESCQNPMMIALKELNDAAGELVKEVHRIPVARLEKLLRDVLHLNGGGGMRLLGYIEHWAGNGNEDAQEIATRLHELLGENLEPVEDVPS